ncbi:MAG: efflux RND transporter periplasmic adaptor subunit [Verrucomicrobiota bacterium]
MATKSNSLLSVILKVVLPLALIGGIFWLFITGLRPDAVVEPVSKGIALDAVPGSLTVNPAYSITLTTEVSGSVLRSALELGKRVEEGEFLIEIDPTDLLLQYEAFKASYESLERRVELDADDRIALQNRQDDLDNFERLFREGTLSGFEIQREREAFQLFLETQTEKKINDETQLRQMEIQLKEWRRTLEKTTVLAPVSGIITRIFAWPGELVGVRTSLAELYSDELLIEAKINEENFAGIQIGHPARIRFLAFGDRIFPATVEKVLPNADPETQQYTVYLQLDEGEEFLRSGLTGEVSIIKNRREDTLLVPRRALFGNFVFVVDNGVVEMRRVRSGFLGLNQAEIIDGVEEGEIVIADEIDRFRDGDKVSVIRPGEQG